VPHLIKHCIVTPFGLKRWRQAVRSGFQRLVLISLSVLDLGHEVRQVDFSSKEVIDLGRMVLDCLHLLLSRLFSSGSYLIVAQIISATALNRFYIGDDFVLRLLSYLLTHVFIVTLYPR